MRFCIKHETCTRHNNFYRITLYLKLIKIRISTYIASQRTQPDLVGIMPAVTVISATRTGTLPVTRSDAAMVVNKLVGMGVDRMV